MAAHADASPSSSSIWINCPASVTKARGRRRLPTIYTAEGSAAHEVADLLIHGLIPPDEIVVDGMTFEVDDDMVDAVERYVEYVEKLKANSDVFRTETQVAVTLPGSEKLYGTADVIAYNRGTENLEVVDLKYGKGVAVSVVGNPQLRIYALGALDSLGAAYPVETVQMTVIQPRTESTPGSNTETLAVHELRDWKNKILLPAVSLIDDDDQTEVTGSHCRWCVRAGECRSLAATRLSDARAVFAPVADPPLPTALTDDELAVILDHAGQIEAWLERVRAEASQRIDHGRAVPGWKLVAKRAMEKWIDADEALVEVNNLFPHVDGLLKLRTPAQVKKTLKAAKEDPDVIVAYTTKKSSGTTLARDDDSREAVGTDAKSVFQQLTDSLAITEKRP